ncbi:MAG: ERAP1-like C-terminal domain-containing protein, partial [Nocardioides sp.]
TLTPEFELDDDGCYTRLAIRQSAHPDWPTLRRHRLGIGLYDDVEGRLVRRTYLETDIEGELTEVAEAVGDRQPALLLLNDGDLAYAKIRLDDRSLITAVDGLSKLDDSLPRALIWGAAWDMTRDAEMSATDYVALVLGNIGSETDSWGVSRIPTCAAQAVTLFSAPDNRDALSTTWEHGLRKLLENAEPGGDHQLTFARSYAGAASSAQAVADLQGLLDGSLGFDGLDVDTDLRWAVLTALARLGRADDARIDLELASDNTISGKQYAAAARASQPTAEAKARAWEQAMVDPETPNETHRSVVLAFQRSGQDHVLAPYVDTYLDAVGSTWERLGTHKGSIALEHIFPRVLASPGLLDKVDTWLETAEVNAGALRYVKEGRADVARALAAQAKDAAG